MPHAPLIACSSGMITDSVSVFALAPGYDADTITIGGAIDGNCEVGSVLMASTPMKMITNDNTIASTGLFINALNILLLFFGVGIIRHTPSGVEAQISDPDTQTSQASRHRELCEYPPA